MSSLLRLEQQQKIFLKIHFLFLSYSFGIETINTFTHSHSSLENHTRFQTKMGKIYTSFQTNTDLKTFPFGAAHTYMMLFNFALRECDRDSH